VHLLALDGKTRGRIHAAYVHSMQSGRWKNQYAARNENEWFAELTKHYFRQEGGAPAFYDPRASRGPAWLRSEDPDGFQLVDDLYAGRIDPGVPRTRTLPLGPASAETAMRSPPSETPSQISVHNGTAAEIRLVWVDFQGQRDRRPSQSAPPGGTIIESSWAGHTFVVTDAEGRGLCTLTAAEDDGTADVKGPCP
jgi:hypothetical protein